MKIGKSGNFGFGRHEEPSFRHKLFQVGSAAKCGRNLRRQRTPSNIGNFFLRFQKPKPEVVRPKGISEKICASIKSFNELTPALALLFIIGGAIVVDQCRITQIACDLKDLEYRLRIANKKIDELEAKLDKPIGKT